MHPRLLFPTLPPELRALIYAQTIAEDNCATSAGLFATKVYDSSHTRVEITPIHYGNPGLLALAKYGFLEGEEYVNWVLGNAVRVRVEVVFKGHLGTFVQEHWDAKMAGHLKKLGKRVRWLGKVVEYEVRIVWRPSSWGHGGKKKKCVGAIAKRMVELVTQEMDEGLGARRGVVEASLYVAHWVVADYVLKGQTLGWEGFIWRVEEGCVRTQIRDVGLALDAGDKDGEEVRGYMPSHFKPMPSTTTTKNPSDREHQSKPVFRREVQKDLDECTLLFEKDGEEDGGASRQAILAIAEEVSGSRNLAHARVQR